jgi:hypothetical protein
MDTCNITVEEETHELHQKITWKIEVKTMCKYKVGGD